MSALRSLRRALLAWAGARLATAGARLALAGAGLAAPLWATRLRTGTLVRRRERTDLNARAIWHAHRHPTGADSDAGATGPADRR
jgi:hypothetical protein